MQRRQFFLAASTLLALPALAQNQSGAVPEPYKQINPAVPGESRKVHAVVAFNCPVCAQYHGMISGWGASLPKQFVFNFLPAVTDKDSAIMAMAWLAMQKVAPHKLTLLASSLFSAVQEKGITASTPGAAMWKKIHQDVAPPPEFAVAFKAVRFDELQVIQSQIAAFQIEATPSIVIGGRYVITPENTNGNQELFLQLANGMVSKVM